MIKTIWLAITILTSCLVISAQIMPANFTYKRETGQESGKPMFSLMPSDISMSYDGQNGKTFEALGATVQPERDIFGLIFMNAKTSYQFARSKDKSCTLTIDQVSTEAGPYLPGLKARVGQLYLEAVGFKISGEVFWNLVKAKDVTIRCGPVTYNLDGDNIEALAAFGAEVQKDLDRRK